MQSKMKVLFLTNIPSPYRVAFFNEIGKYCDLTVVFEKDSSVERDESWKLYETTHFKAVYLKGPKWGVAGRVCLSVIKYLRTKYDHVVITNFSDPTGIISLLYLKAKHISYEIESDGGFPGTGKGIKEKIKKWLMSGAELYFSTANVHDEYYKLYGAKEDRIVRYPFTSIYDNEILERPLTIKEKRVIRDELHISEEKCILTVGQFVHRKGFDLLLQASKSFKSNIGVYFIGGVPTNEYIHMAKGNNNIHFIGFLNSKDLTKYYLASDLFILPTREDIWGLVVNEAMAKGLPVVTTDRCIAGLELVDDTNGCIIPTESVEAIKSSVEKCLINDRYPYLCTKSLTKIKDYSIEKMARRHIEIWEVKSK